MYFLDSSYKIHYCTIYIMMMIHDTIQLSMLGYFLSTQTKHIPRTLLWLHNPLSTLLIPMCILCAWDGISLVTDLANIETMANVAIFLLVNNPLIPPPPFILGHTTLHQCFYGPSSPVKHALISRPKTIVFSRSFMSRCKDM